MKQIYGIWFPEDDTHFETVMKHDGSYQKDVLDAAMEYVKEPKMFYDIGAHVGLWSLMAQKAGFKEIYAFEPNPSTYVCLEKNVNKEIKIFNRAISSQSTHVDILIQDIGNSGAIKLAYNTGCIKASPIHYVGEVFNQSGNVLVKIDTEGAEADCINGMREIIYATRPIMIVEQRTNKDALDILYKMGMEKVKQIRKDHVLVWKNQ